MTDPGMSVTPAGLAAWAGRSRVASRPAAVTSARAAMHAARLASPTPSGRRRFGMAVPSLAVLRRHPVRVTAGSMAAAATLVMAMGWDAAPGSPLHTIQLAREDVSLVLASPGHAVALRLDYAEARLRDAVSSSDRRDSLAEAASLLNTVRQELPANHADPLWARWSDDQRFLATLLAGKAAPSSQANRGGAGGRDDGSPVTGSTGDRGGRGSQSGGDGGGASPAGAPASPTGPDRGGDGSGSGRQPSSAPAPADGGGGDGSRGATGGGSSTLSPAPSGGDGGRGGQD